MEELAREIIDGLIRSALDLGKQSEYEEAIEDADVLLTAWAKERDARVLDFINEWGGFDGAHHKQWVLDQLVRIVAGDGYEKWVAEHRAGDEGPDTYEWDEGIAP